MKIDRIVGRKIYDGFGFPAVACDTILDAGVLVTASLPMSFYDKQQSTDWAVLDEAAMSLVNCINTQLAPLFAQQEPNCIEADVILGQLRASGVHENEASNLLVVSMSLYRAHALVEHLDLYEFISCVADTVIIDAPRPMVSVLRCYSTNQTIPLIEEYYIIPDPGYTAMRAVDVGMAFTHVFGSLYAESLGLVEHCGVWHAAKHITPQQCLDALSKAITVIEQQYGLPCSLGIRSAAPRLYDAFSSDYGTHTQRCTTQDVIKSYVSLAASYPLRYIHDGVSAADSVGVALMKECFSSTHMHHLFTHSSDAPASTQKNVRALMHPKTANTVTELIEAMAPTESSPSHHISTIQGSIDSFMVDVAVGVTAQHMFSGGCLGGPSIDHYNRLVMIAEQLQDF